MKEQHIILYHVYTNAISLNVERNYIREYLMIFISCRQSPTENNWQIKFKIYLKIRLW